MLNFRDAGIKEKLEPLCMAIINSNEKKVLFIILAMISVSKMKNSVYINFNWTGGFLQM